MSDLDIKVPRRVFALHQIGRRRAQFKPWQTWEDDHGPGSLMRDLSWRYGEITSPDVNPDLLW